MKILIVGLGSIGKRHLENIRGLVAGARVAIWRQRNKQSPPNAAEDLAVDQVFYSQADALDYAPDAAIIASPSSMHVSNASALARQGVHLFVEKPLADSLAGVGELLEICKKQGSALMVGYNLRFYDPLCRIRDAINQGRIGRVVSVRAEVGQYLPDWRPGQDYRRSASASEALGGGVVMELSHELDYVRWLVGEVASVYAVTGQLSDLEIDVEDMAEIILEFSSGAIGSVHLDMMQRVSTRSCRIVGTEGTIEWDIRHHRARSYRVEEDQWSDLHPEAAVDMNDTYVRELRHFFDCVRNGGDPIVTGEDGRRVLEILLAIKESAKLRRRVSL
jgi:predicted dehydrogenase